ncbi:MAG: SDR family NAD(P)-dependent oxidoreductase [Prochlorococcus sp.]
MRTAMITGSTKGIGRAIALRLLEAGHRLSLGLRSPQALTGSKLDPEISGAERVLTHPYEARDSTSVLNWVSNSIKHFGEIDTLIHCAGVFHRTPLVFSDHQQREIDELLQVNLMGPWLLTRAAWPHLINNHSSRIIVLVSMSGKRSKGNLAGYTASKFALMGLCQTIRNEGWNSGVRVTVICPSWVNTDMAAAVKTLPKEDMTQAEDIATLTSQLLEMPNSCVPFELALNCNLER